MNVACCEKAERLTKLTFRRLSVATPSLLRFFRDSGEKGRLVSRTGADGTCKRKENGAGSTWAGS